YYGDRSSTLRALQHPCLDASPPNRVPCHATRSFMPSGRWHPGSGSGATDVISEQENLMSSEEKMKEDRQVSRRQLLKTSVGLIGAGAGLSMIERSAFASEPERAAVPAVPANDTMIGMKFEARDTVRLGVIGVGGRGTGMLSNFLAIPHVQVN